MGSYYSRIVIESYEDSFSLVGTDDHFGLQENELRSLFNDWLNNEMKRISYQKEKERI